MTDRLALVTGATGGIGGAVAEALRRHGWRVRGLARDPDRARRCGPAQVDWVAGDALREADMLAAAQGARILFHGVNPPGYRDWRGLALPMLAHAITAAQAAGARLVMPGNLYVYAPEAGPRIGEDAPCRPRTRKGAVRVEMEAMLDAAEGLDHLIVRAGDFFGPRAPSSWVTTVLMRGGRPLRRVVTPEIPGAGHAWAYLPDLAETFARLLDDAATLPRRLRLNFRGHHLQGRAMAEAVAAAAARPGGRRPPVRPFAWAPVYVGAPFVTFLREVIEMRYLWPTTLELDNARLVARLGAEPHTPLDAAAAASLAALRSRAA
ncbi:NAD(P)H-binding protein [Methylobacterium sp. M6A4_1b]